MTEGIHITSVDALRDFQTSLVRYSRELSDILVSAEMEAKQVLAEVEDALSRALQRTENCKEDVAQARADLSNCRQASSDEDEDETDCSAEEVAMDEAENKVRDAEERVETLHHARNRLEEAIAGYLSQSNLLRDFLEDDLSRGDGILATKINAVEKYLAVTSPGITSVSKSPPLIGNLLLQSGGSSPLSIPGDIRQSTSCSSHDPTTITTDYQALRKRTPTAAIRKMVNAVKVKFDPVYGHQVPVFQADHIIPFNEILGMPGFNGLSEERKLAIVNMPSNFLGVSGDVNRSRKNTSWEEWRGHSRFGPVPPDFKEAMIAKSQTLRVQIQSEIDKGKGHG